MRAFVISQPDYGDEGVDSVWLDEDAALVRASELGVAFITEYEVGRPNGFVRNGWYAPKGTTKCWSDWGYGADEPPGHVRG